MTRLSVVVCLCVAAALAAVPGPGSASRLWTQFDRMAQAERENAVLSLEPSPQALAGAWDESREICRLWNAGDFAAALERLRVYYRFDNPSQVTVGISWRKPVEYPRQTFDAAVRIGTRDSLADLMMDRSADGTLWACTPQFDSGDSRMVVYKSTDDGSSWSEVSYFWSSEDNDYGAWCAVCNGAYYAVFFARRAYSTNVVWTHRLRMSDGQWVRYYSGDSGSVTGIRATPGDTVKELAACSQEDTLPGFRVYLFGRASGRLLYESWADSACGPWTPHSTGVTTCDNGLDCTFSEGSTERKLWASWITYTGADSAYPAWGYYTTADTLFHTGGSVYSETRRRAFEPTSISAWHDTVGIAYTPPWGRCRILTTPNAGNSWSVGDLTPYEPDTAEFPELTGRDGGGFAAAYRVRTTPANCWIDVIHSDLVGGPYSAPDTVSDNSHRPSPTAHIRIVPLGSGSYGVGWINWDDAVNGGAWFAVYTPSGIAERPATAPLPFAFHARLCRGGADLCFDNPAPGPVRLRVFDRTGRIVRAENLTMAAGQQSVRFQAPISGVYVAVLEAKRKSVSTRFAAVR